MAPRNVCFALLGAAGLVLKSSYAGPLQPIVRSYGGNLSVSFALYFALVSATRRHRHPRVIAALITLAAVASFELTDGFGIMANTYDPVDLLANGAGVGSAVLVDLLSDRLMSRGRGGGSAVTEPAPPADGRERQPELFMKVRSETVEMAAITGTRRGEDPRRTSGTSEGTSPEDARQGCQIRGRSRSFVNNSGQPE